MPSPEMTEFLSYLDQLMTATAAGKIEWGRLNPTTFTWATLTARVNLQRVDQVTQKVEPGKPPVLVRTTNYVFQALEGALQKLTVSGTEDSLVNQKLGDLYAAITGGYSRRGLDFLRSLLPPAE